MSRQNLKKGVQEAAGKLLFEKGYISPVDLLQKMGRLTPQAYRDWREGRVLYLEKVCQGNLKKLSFILNELKDYAREKDLHPSRTVYKKWGKGRKHRLQFSKTQNPALEKAYSTHFVSPAKKKK